MVNLFKSRLRDVKEIRNALLQFIKDKLQRTTGGEGGNISGLHLFVYCSDAERHLYEAALYANNAGKFKTEEIQRIADDYAISLPASWKFEIIFTDKYPPQSYIAKDIDAALFIATKNSSTAAKKNRAYIKVLNGQAESETYLIDTSLPRINIGREAKIQAAGGFIRKNNIAFVSSGGIEMNRSISRQHAHIEWDHATGSFIIYADEGGIPPHNKMKIRTPEGQLIKMQAIEVGHRLNEGDQVILGDSAVLEFSYVGE